MVYEEGGDYGNGELIEIERRGMGGDEKVRVMSE